MYKSIAVGTMNQSKLTAVETVLSEYEDVFPNSEVVPVKVESLVPEQPIGFNEIIKGAKERAKNAFLETQSDIAIGIEDGIAEMQETRTGYMNFCCVAFYDGHEFVIGMSGGFEYPRDVIKDVIEHKKNITDSFFERGLTDNPNIGADEGALGIMTKGRETRADATKSALRRALIQIENKDLF